MSRKVIVSDSGPIISLACINYLYILEVLFDQIYIPKAVWNELTKNERFSDSITISDFFIERILAIKSTNQLIAFMDLGESEAVILYNEIDADYLLIDDKKARQIAESVNVNCIGTLGLITIAKENGIIKELRPVFIDLLKANRYYSLIILNSILSKYGELQIESQ